MSKSKYDILDKPRDETDYLAIGARWAQENLENAQAAAPDADHSRLEAKRDQRVNNLAEAAVSIVERQEIPAAATHEAVHIPVQASAPDVEKIPVHVG